MIRIEVRNNDVEKAIRQIKKVLNREGVFKEMRARRYHEKTFVTKQRKKREARSRAMKAEYRRRADS